MKGPWTGCTGAPGALRVSERQSGDWIDDQLDDVRLQIDTTLPAAAAFEIVKILSGAHLDRMQDRVPRQVSG